MDVRWILCCCSAFGSISHANSVCTCSIPPHCGTGSVHIASPLRIPSTTSELSTRRGKCRAANIDNMSSLLPPPEVKQISHLPKRTPQLAPYFIPPSEFPLFSSFGVHVMISATTCIINVAFLLTLGAHARSEGLLLHVVVSCVCVCVCVRVCS